MRPSALSTATAGKQVGNFIFSLLNQIEFILHIRLLDETMANRKE